MAEERAESQTTAGITPFQDGAPALGPSRERLDGPAARRLTFDALSNANELRANRWHRGFPRRNAGGWTGGDWSNAMQGEAGEAGNIVKKLRRWEEGFRGVLDRPPPELLVQLGEELADTLIYADLLGTYYGIDLPAAIIDKFNRVSELQGFPERLGDG